MSGPLSDAIIRSTDRLVDPRGHWADPDNIYHNDLGVAVVNPLSNVFCCASTSYYAELGIP